MRSRTGTGRRAGSFKLGAEREFSHKVDIEVPPHGLGRCLLFMMKWCREKAGEGNWANHGHMDAKPTDPRPIDYARFYFKDYETAESFAKKFAGRLTASVKSYRLSRGLRWNKRSPDRVICSKRHSNHFRTRL